MADWEPIETAPKDGTHIIGFHYYPQIIAWRSLWLRQGGKDMYGWVLVGGDIGNHVQGVTHWMPLPPPPETDNVPK